MPYDCSERSPITTNRWIFKVKILLQGSAWGTEQAAGGGTLACQGRKIINPNISEGLLSASVALFNQTRNKCHHFHQFQGGEAGVWEEPDRFQGIFRGELKSCNNNIWQQLFRKYIYVIHLNVPHLGRDNSPGDGKEHVPTKLRGDEEALWRRGGWVATREMKKNCSFLLAKFKTRNHVQTFLQVKHYQQLAGRREDELGLLRGEVGFLFDYQLLLLLWLLLIFSSLSNYYYYCLYYHHYYDDSFLLDCNSKAPQILGIYWLMASAFNPLGS